MGNLLLGIDATIILITFQNTILVLDTDAILSTETMLVSQSYIPSDLSRFRLGSGHVFFGAGAIINSNKPISLGSVLCTNNSNIISGIYNRNRTRVVSSTLNNVNLVCRHFNNNDFLYILNSTINYDFTGQKAISVQGKRYSISGSTFNINGNCKAISSVNLTQTSVLINNSFSGNTLSPYVTDWSNTLLNAYRNDFTNSRGNHAVTKNQGAVGAGCNTFFSGGIGFVHGPYSELLAAPLPANYSNYGYNNFGSLQISIKQSYRSFAPYLDYGYNDFSFGGISSQYFRGTIDDPLVSSILARRNAWSGSTITPPQSQFDLTQLNSGVAVPVLGGIGATASSCGQFNNPSGNIAFSNNEPLLPSINVPGGSGAVDIDDALSMAVSYSEVYDTINGDNILALQIFHAIIMPDFTSYTDRDDINRVKNFAFKQMKYTYHSALEKDQITLNSEATVFDATTQLFVDALNKRSEFIVSDSLGNAYLFDNELEKSHFFNVIGKSQTALSILYNAEYCGLDSIDQVVLNAVKFYLEERAAELNYGFPTVLLDTVFTDTSAYNIASGSNNSEPYLFSSIINGVSSIQYANDCSSQANKLPVTLDDDFSIFPNPTSDYLTFKYQVGLKDNAKVTIFNLDGKLVLEKWLPSDINQESITIQNLSSGLYIYRYEVNNEIIKTGKVTKL